jgi:hypothetical protein
MIYCWLFLFLPVLKRITHFMATPSRPCASPFSEAVAAHHTVASLDDYKRLKQRVQTLLPVARQVLERLHQSEDLYLGAKALELLAENMYL